MKPFQINAATPLLIQRRMLTETMGTLRRSSDATLRVYTGDETTIPSHAAQAIIQSMIDAVEADLRALGVDLS